MSIVFSDAAVEHFGEQYRAEAKPMHGESARGGCMRAVYIGLGSLFGDRYKFRGDFHKEFFRAARKKEKAKSVPEGRFNTIDRVFRALENEGVALGEHKFKPSGGRWKLPDGTKIENLEQALHDQIDGLVEGSYFFGVAVNGAIHSIILRLDNTIGFKSTFWMDQFSEGFNSTRAGGFVDTPDVTGQLDEAIRQFGKNTTSVWELDAVAAQGIFVPGDTTGDSVPDASRPAVEERELPGSELIDL